MKKKLSLLFLGFIFCLILSISICFIGKSGASKDIISYNGKEYDKKNLSLETLKWLEWYNDLSDDTKMMIDYIPYELQEKDTISELNKTMETD